MAKLLSKDDAFKVPDPLDIDGLIQHLFEKNITLK